MVMMVKERISVYDWWYMFVILKYLSMALCAYGVFVGYVTYKFVTAAIVVNGTIAPTDAYKGPPRSPRAIPITVSFSPPSNNPSESEKVLVSLPSPMFRRLELGQPVTLLVNPNQLSEARFASITELWAFPGGLLLGGIGLLLVSIAAQGIRPPACSFHSSPPLPASEPVHDK